MPATTKNADPKQFEDVEDDRAQHILVVDDEYEVANSIQAALNAIGFKVSVARDGNHGVAIAESMRTDLMILDMMMPRRSGLLVLERLRQFHDQPIPVIMITGNEGKRHKKYAEMLGISDYFQKPFQMDKLIESVRNVLQTQP